MLRLVIVLIAVVGLTGCVGDSPAPTTTAMDRVVPQVTISNARIETIKGALITRLQTEHWQILSDTPSTLLAKRYANALDTDAHATFTFAQLNKDVQITADIDMIFLNPQTGREEESLGTEYSIDQYATRNDLVHLLKAELPEDVSNLAAIHHSSHLSRSD